MKKSALVVEFLQLLELGTNVLNALHSISVNPVNKQFLMITIWSKWDSWKLKKLKKKNHTDGIDGEFLAWKRTHPLSFFLKIPLKKIKEKDFIEKKMMETLSLQESALEWASCLEDYPKPTAHLCLRILLWNSVNYPSFMSLKIVKPKRIYKWLEKLKKDWKNFLSISMSQEKISWKSLKTCLVPTWKNSSKSLKQKGSARAMSRYLKLNRNRRKNKKVSCLNLKNLKLNRSKKNQRLKRSKQKKNKKKRKWKKKSLKKKNKKIFQSLQLPKSPWKNQNHSGVTSKSQLLLTSRRKTNASSNWRNCSARITSTNTLSSSTKTVSSLRKKLSINISKRLASDFYRNTFHSITHYFVFRKRRVNILWKIKLHPLK